MVAFLGIEKEIVGMTEGYVDTSASTTFDTSYHKTNGYDEMIRIIREWDEGERSAVASMHKLFDILERNEIVTGS